MTDMSRQHEDRSVQSLASELGGAALSDYDALAEDWARRGWLHRAIALCKVILRLEPGHVPTQRLLARLDARQLDAPAPVRPRPEPLDPPPAAEVPHTPLLSRLGKQELLSVLEVLELRVFPQGEILFEEGQPGSSMFAIVEGSVEVVRTLRSGRRRTVAFLGEGDFFGEMALLSDMPRSATVKAFERTAVLELTRERLERIVQQHPSVGEVLQSFYRERLLSDVLRANPLFRALTPERRAALARDFQLCSRREGEFVLVQGQEVDALYVVLRGRCRVLHRHPDGREDPPQTLGEGGMFGEFSLMLGQRAAATVCADSPCLLLRLDREHCERHLFEQLQRLAGRPSGPVPEDAEPRG